MPTRQINSLRDSLASQLNISSSLYSCRVKYIGLSLLQAGEIPKIDGAMSSFWLHLKIRRLFGKVAKCMADVTYNAIDKKYSGAASLRKKEVQQC